MVFKITSEMIPHLPLAGTSDATPSHVQAFHYFSFFLTLVMVPAVGRKLDPGTCQKKGSATQLRWLDGMPETRRSGQVGLDGAIRIASLMRLD
jgi:hypothetical protein